MFFASYQYDEDCSLISVAHASYLVAAGDRIDVYPAIQFTALHVSVYYKKTSLFPVNISILLFLQVTKGRSIIRSE